MSEKSSYAALFSEDATGSVMTARTPTDLRDDTGLTDFLFEIDLVVVDANCVETLCANDIAVDIKTSTFAARFYLDSIGFTIER
jgi:hypothetical protein|tara:strand:- start:143 stop:394 length:252 start_codon:yes stop_codon:yes gene_type:complete|mmetsp:Transcript_7807/g.23226  ORF Transcript_7807/g.23226 Transcript_7807/m.23226 type:complete len:84 (+) Transcript_7807:1002-1253(+)